MSLTAAALYALVGVQGASSSVRDLQSVSSQVNKTQGVMAGLGKNAGQIGKGLGQVGGGMLRIAETLGVAALAAAGASAKVGATFEQMTELIHTQAGASQAEVDKMRLGIQAMVHEVGTGPNELAKALYHIESVGVRDAEALDVLHASAIGAKVGLADMESVTNALTAVWFSGIKGAKNMTDAMAILDGIVGVGNMHLQDLTDSFRSGILGTAATYGVDIRSLGAAIATLTDAGVPADIAATRLNNTLTHLAAPTKQAIGVMKDLKLSQFDLAKDLRKPDGIDVALRDLGTHLQALGEMDAKGVLTPQGAADMSKLFGGSRFGATAMQLLTNAMKPVAEGGDRIAQKYKLITERSQTFADNVKKTMETAGFKFGQFEADVKESALAFSQGFLPALARAGSKLDAFLIGHHNDFVTLGKDLGAWIDKIDWKGVEDGANSFIGVLKTGLDLVSKIPPQVDLAIVGFLALNKLSGGLVGKGIENIAGGLAGVVGTLGKAALRNVLGKLPVIGGVANALTSTPVYITGMAPGVGFGMGGGVPGIGGAAAAEAGGIAGLLSKAGSLVFKVAMVAGFAELAMAIAGPLQDFGTQLHGAIFGKGGDPFSDFGKAWTEWRKNADWPFGQKNAPEWAGGPPSKPNPDLTAKPDPKVLAMSIPQILAAYQDNENVNGGLSLGARDEMRDMRDAAIAAASAMQATKDASQGTADELRDMAEFAKATTQAEKKKPPISSTLAYLLKGIEERSQAKYHWKDGKPPESWVMGTFGRDLLRYEGNILRSHRTATQKLDDVQRLEALAVAGKDWGVARKLKADIRELKETIQAQKTEITINPQLIKLVVDGITLATALTQSQQLNRGAR